MKPKLCTATNFGSYEHLEFDFADLGLTLVSGETGAGKSSLCDFVPWCLYGETSKSGAADDVRKWGADEPTQVTLEVTLPDATITVTRIRGKAHQNDLYWTEARTPDTKVRGKDATETQKLLNERLKCDPELYLISSYFGQFSAAGEFFSKKPKDRREVLERITDLTLPVTLSEKAAEARKTTKKDLETLELSRAKNQGKLEQIERQVASTQKAFQDWETKQETELSQVKVKLDSFEAEKEETANKIVTLMEEIVGEIKPAEYFTETQSHLDDLKGALTDAKAAYQLLLPEVSDLKSKLATAQRDIKRLSSRTGACPTCLGPTDNHSRRSHLEAAKQDEATYQAALEVAKGNLSELEDALAAEHSLLKAFDDLRREKAHNDRMELSLETENNRLQALQDSPNIYADRYEALSTAINPFKKHLGAGEHEAKELKNILAEGENKIATMKHRVVSLTQVYDLGFALRGEMLRSAVQELEYETNRRIQTYFDGAFRVGFLLEDSDKLAVEIHAGEYIASFKSLSGGQRRMLTVAFSTALMKLAANTAGISPDLIIFDEVLNGLSPDLKVQAFRLFEEMSTEVGTILFIDHDESVKQCFSSCIEVSLEGGNSVISFGERSEDQVA